jgi:hypothetical protein
MNHIKHLMEENKRLEGVVGQLEEGINEVLKYVSSEKFRSDDRSELYQYVNVSDIILRLNEVKQIL